MRLPHFPLQHGYNAQGLLLGKRNTAINYWHYRERLIEAEHQFAAHLICQKYKNLTSVLERERGEDKTSSHSTGCVQPLGHNQQWRKCTGGCCSLKVPRKTHQILSNATHRANPILPEWRKLILQCQRNWDSRTCPAFICTGCYLPSLVLKSWQMKATFYPFQVLKHVSEVQDLVHGQRKTTTPFNLT